MKNPFPREPMWAREAVQGLEPGSLAGAGAGRDRLSDRDLTLGWVREYESGVCKVKKEIPAKTLPRKAVRSMERVEVRKSKRKFPLKRFRGNLVAGN